MINASDLTLTNVGTGISIAPEDLQFGYDTNTATARWTFAGDGNEKLPSGYYHASIPSSSVSDALGRPLPADLLYKFLWINGTEGDDRIRFDVRGNVFLDDSGTPAFTTSGETPNELAIVTGAGDDVPTLATSGGTQPFLARWDAGLGNDELLIDGTSGQDIVVLGHDTVDVQFLATSGSASTDVYGVQRVHFIGKGGADRVNAADADTYLLQAELTGGTVTVHESVTLAGDLRAVSAATNPSLVVAPYAQRNHSLTQHIGLHRRLRAAVFQHWRQQVLVLTSLVMQSNSLLDVNDNALVADYLTASSLVSIRSRINSARAGGTWTGAGITSTAAKNANPKNTTLGVMEASRLQIDLRPRRARSPANRSTRPRCS